MARRQPAAHVESQQPSREIVSLKVATLLSILGILVGLWSHFDNTSKADQSSRTDAARATGALEAFKDKQQQTDKDFLEGMRRLNDRMSVHERDSEAEHREMRRDLETEFRRDVDANCHCTEKRK